MFNGRSANYNNSNYNNGGGDVNVNTSLLFFSNPDANCELRTRAWNRQLSLAFAPFLGVRDDGVRMYEKERARIASTALSLENALILLKGYEEKIRPAIESHSEKKISVDIGREPTKKCLSLGYDGMNAYLQLSSDVNENGVTSADRVITYTFGKRTVREDFNVLTGEGSSYEEEAELDRFINALRMVPLFGAEISHGIRLDKENRAAFANNHNAAQQAPYGGQIPNANNAFMPPSGGSFNVPNAYGDELPFN